MNEEKELKEEIEKVKNMINDCECAECSHKGWDEALIKLKEQEQMEKIWNDTMMCLVDEDYLIEPLEELKNSILVFIGRSLREGKTQTLEKVKEKIEKLEKDFESRLDENNKPDIVNSQVNGVLLGLSFVKNFLNDKEEI